MSKPSKYKLVYVEWRDAEGECTWGEKAEVDKWGEKDCLIYELGWLVSENKKHIIITNQITYDGMIGNRTKIPVKWIKKIDYLTIKRTPRKDAKP